VDFYPWHKSVLVSDPSKSERASELVRKSSLLLVLPPSVSPKCRVDIDGLIVESLHSSICSVEIKHACLRASSGDSGLNYES
jgi:hypothetical protein